MPQVPRYTDPTVQTIAAATPQMQGLPADAFGAGLGQGLTKAAGAFGEIAQQMQQNVNHNFKMQVMPDVINTANDLADGPDGFRKELGVNASKVTLEDGSVKQMDDYVMDQFKEKRDEWMDKAATPMQKAIVQQLFDEHAPALHEKLMVHINSQEAVAADQSMDALISMQNRFVADNPTTENINTAAKNIADGLKTYPKYQGMSDIAQSEYNRSLVSQLQVTSITGLLAKAKTADNSDDEDGFNAAAAGRYKGYYDSIDPKQRDALAPQIEHADNSVQAGAVSKETWTKFKPESVNDKIDVEAANAYIDAKHLNNEATQIAKAKLTTQLQQYHANVEQSTQAVSDTVNGMILDGKNYAQVHQEIMSYRGYGQEVPDTALQHMEQYAQHHFKVGEQDPLANMTDKIVKLGKLMQFQQDYLGGKLGSLTPQQAAAKVMPTLGEQTPAAMKFVEDANANMGNAKLSEGQFKEKLLSLRGMDPDGTTYPALKDLLNDKKPETKANRALILNNILSEVRTLQENFKPADLDGIIQKNITNFITSPGYIFSSEKPFGAISDKDIQGMDDQTLRTYVYRRMTVGSTPPTEAQLQEGIRRAKLPPKGKR